MASSAQDQEQLELTDLEDSSAFPSGSTSNNNSHPNNGSGSGTGTSTGNGNKSNSSTATSGDKSRKLSTKSRASFASPQKPTGLLSSSTDPDVDIAQSQKELLALERLDDKSIQLQQEGKYTEALECMEKALVLRQHFFGADSDQVWTCCQTVGEMCNLLAMTFLQQEEFSIVLELLKKAEVLTEKHPQGKAVTLNNLACYHRRQGNLHKALSYLTHAMEIENKLDNIANRADTHLNLCAVLSQLGKHQGALDHAQAALILLHEELFSNTNGTANRNATEPDSGSPTALTSNNLIESKLDRVAVLGIAYHNVGVEQEFLKRYEASLQSYTKGVELTKKYLGDHHGIVVTLQNSLVTAKEAIKSRMRSDKSGDGITRVSKQMARFLKLKSPLSKSYKASTGSYNSTSSHNNGNGRNSNGNAKQKQKSRVATEG